MILARERGERERGSMSISGVDTMVFDHARLVGVRGKECAREGGRVKNNLMRENREGVGWGRPRGSKRIIRIIMFNACCFY